MDQFRNLGDERQHARCVHCGETPTTRDHIPSKILLDDPLPPNLPVVGACERCNNRLSLDEEYLACLIECTLAGSLSERAIQREKIKCCLQRSPKLTQLLIRAKSPVEGRNYFTVDMPRVRNVVLKLARGHSIFDLNEPHWEEPRHLMISPVSEMKAEQRTAFENPPSGLELWPEVGGRAMQRLVRSQGLNSWIVVQPKRYRYLVTVDDSLLIRIVLGEYLGCEIRW